MECFGISTTGRYGHGACQICVDRHRHLVFGYAVACFLYPVDVAGRFTGYGLDAAAGMVEIRAMYGGLQAGFGVFCLLAGFRREWTRPGLTAIACVMGGLVLTRSIAMGIHGPAGANPGAAIYEESPRRSRYSRSRVCRGPSDEALPAGDGACAGRRCSAGRHGRGCNGGGQRAHRGADRRRSRGARRDASPPSCATCTATVWFRTARPISTPPLAVP